MSANLSKQAQGGEVGKAGELRMQSWEAGVVVQLALFTTSSTDAAIIVLVVGQDILYIVDIMCDANEALELTSKDQSQI